MLSDSFRIAALSCTALLLFLQPSRAQPSQVMEWNVDGVKREALVYAPSKSTSASAPVILAFHGHGGTMRNMGRKGFQSLWPEAIVVCPQGLPTKTLLDPEGKRAGWQQRSGVNDDRDVKFVDAILKTLRQKHRVDDQRIYVTGHSNGGGFTYLLWAARGSEFAALGPVAGGPGPARTGKGVRPIPVLHVAGEKDQIVKFANQQRTMETVRMLDGCEAEGKPWTKAGNLTGTIYASSRGAPFVSVIHPGGHEFPDHAAELIVRFFREHARPQAAK